MNYRTRLEVFEGPPDFLLYLVEEGLLPVTEIPLGELTQGLREEMERLEADDAGNGLVVSALLLWRKARALLEPSGEADDGPAETEVEVGERRARLAEQLALYGLIKQTAERLAVREMHTRRHFRRPAGQPGAGPLPFSHREEALSLERLWQALQGLRNPSRETVKIPSPLEVSVEEVMADIMRRLHRGTGRGRRLALTSLPAPEGPAKGLIVFFLAVLELVRRGAVAVIQEGPLEEIFLLGLRAEAEIPLVAGGCRCPT